MLNMSNPLAIYFNTGDPGNEFIDKYVGKHKRNKT